MFLEFTQQTYYGFLSTTSTMHVQSLDCTDSIVDSITDSINHTACCNIAMLSCINTEQFDGNTMRLSNCSAGTLHVRSGLARMRLAVGRERQVSWLASSALVLDAAGPTRQAVGCYRLRCYCLCSAQRMEAAIQHGKINKIFMSTNFVTSRRIRQTFQRQIAFEGSPRVTEEDPGNE